MVGKNKNNNNNTVRRTAQNKPLLLGVCDFSDAGAFRSKTKSKMSTTFSKEIQKAKTTSDRAEQLPLKCAAPRCLRSLFPPPRREETSAATVEK